MQPVSKQTREYILSLDIERDARVLKERLNIGRDALDYFCASSSILKAGVRAGLSLYDIAIMCCRNDNLGEVPSKLELLFSMAAELAASAIENGRWHHAAALRALEEQLSPRGGSLFDQTPNKRVQKAVSAMDLSHYSEDLTSLSAKRENIPSMIQSCASDSSSDNGDGDGDDCEEWAANLIADVGLDKSMTAIGKKTRSSSMESDSSNESEEDEGFWYTKPDFLPDSSLDSDDDESVSWSPTNSPRDPSFLESTMRHSYNPFGASRRASIVLPSEEYNESFKQFRSPSKVTFADLRDETYLDSHPKYKHSNSDVGHADVPRIPRPEAAMRRSQSYSALSSTITEKMATEDEDALQVHRPIDPEQHREYFLKFIDLVIVRETTAAAQLKVGS